MRKYASRNGDPNQVEPEALPTEGLFAAKPGNFRPAAQPEVDTGSRRKLIPSQ
jgi:hypothetical protein